MRRTWLVALLAAALLAAGCGSRTSEEQVRAEAREDAQAAGIRAGAASGAAGEAEVEGSGFEATDDAATAGVTGGSGSGGGAAASAGRAPGAPAGGNGGATDVGLSATEMKLGWVGTLTGPVPGLFRGALIGAQAAAAYQNSRGGLFGRSVKVVAGDDGLDSGKNRAAHLQLKDQVFAFVGSFSVNDDGGVGVLEDCKCPDIGGALSANRLNSAMHYDPQPSKAGWRTGAFNYYKAHYPKDVIEHVAFFVSAIESARVIARNERAVLESLGYKVVYTREVQANEVNFTGDIIQMRNQGVKMLIYQGDVGNMSRMAKAMRDQGFTVELANWGNAIYDDNAFTIATKEALEGAIIDQVYAMFKGEDAARIPEVALFAQWMKRTDPKQVVDLFSMYGWVSMRLYLEAAEKAGAQLTRPKLLAELGKIGTWDANGMVAPVNVGQKKASDCIMMMKIVDGKFTRLHPTGQTFDCGLGPYVYR